jgi:FkbM family methyltransferase
MSIIKRKIRKNLIGLKLFIEYFLERELLRNPVKGYSESDMIFLFFKYFSKKNILIDVGAHCGESFRPYEKAGWSTFAFEPDPVNRKRITVRSPLTKLSDFAVSDEDDQELTLYISPESSGISSLAPFHPSHQASVKVKTKTLATVCRTENISNVDFLKIDTEGFDLFVLKGFPFDTIQPMVILSEFEDAKTLNLGYSYQDLGNFFTNYGYTVYLSEWQPIVKYGGQHTWERIVKFPNAELRNVQAWGNFIAIRSDCISNFEIVKNAYLKSLIRNA